MSDTHARTESPRNAERVDWADFARGIGIVLVVVGHTLRGLVNAGIVTSGPVEAAVDAWIYAFHMPLMFFVAGLFAADAGRKAPLQFLGDKARTILYPYFVWSIAQTCVEAVFARYTNAPTSLSDLRLVLHQPIKQFWFFYALFLIAGAFYVLRRARVPLLGCLVFALIGRHLALNSGMGAWPIANVAASELVYFALGMLLARHAARIGTALSPAAALAVFGAGGGLIAWSLAQAAPTAPLLAQWIDVSRALAGIAGTVALATLLARVRGFELVRRFGVCSLQIFVAHTLASAGARIALRKLFGVDAPLVHLAVGTVAGIAGPLVFGALCDKVGFRYAFAWPKRRRPAEIASLQRSPLRESA